jgi:hypothetical protein
MQESEAALGTAITSASHPHRKSRSVGEARDDAPSITTTVRRRSDEIRYWRESYDPGLLSPVSSNQVGAEEQILLDQPEMPHDQVPQDQPQPFNFGLIGEMAGMKITEAASLETRVQILENRMLEMEQATDPPKRNWKRDRSTSTNRPRTDNSENTLPKQPRCRGLQPQQEYGPRGSQKRSSSYGSRRPSTVSIYNLYHPSFDIFSSPELLNSDEQMPVNLSQTVSCPLSTSTTIRGIPSSSPSTCRDANLTAEHYTLLTNMILAEQAGRRHLEAMVLNLQQQLLDLLPSGATSNLKPDSDFLAADLMKESGREELLTFERDDSSDDEKRLPHDEVFQTPNEERGSLGGDDIFGDVNGGGIKTTTRTLSLSQMTRARVCVQPSPA